MHTKHIKSWITVLSVFFIVVLGCIGWEKFTSVTIAPIEAQLVYDQEPVLAKISPSVVSMWAVKQKGLETHINVIGCGLIVDSRGLILTSATLTDDIESLYFIDSEDREYQADIIATDKKTQLTLLKADLANNEQSRIFEAAQLADFKRVKRGDTIFVLGSRRTPDSWELMAKTGRITDPYQSLIIKKVKYRDLIQTDVSLTAENAGGPLVNLKGEVLGFALPFVRPEGRPATFSYAVGVNQGKIFLARLPIPQWTEGASEPICSWLGAEMLPVNPVIATGFSVPDGRGEVINHIQNNSPAEHAGLKRGDVVMDINGEKITGKSSFDKIALGLCQTNKTKLRVLRKGRLKTLTLNWNKHIYVPSGSGSMAEVVLVVLIFSVMYYFVYKNVFDRVALFVLGAIVVTITGHHLGFYEQDQMASALLGKLDVLLFIVGMQLVTGVLDEAGALEYLAKKITLATGGNSWRIMWLFCLVTYACSLVVNNLTTIMLMAPMVLSLSKYLDCNPKPFLISMIVASNLGGASTMVGDFPNILIGTETGLPFYQFTSYMLPVCLLELFVLLVYLRVARPSIFKAATPLPLSTADGYPNFEPLDEDCPELSGPADGADSNYTLLNTIRNRLGKTIKSRDVLKRGLIILTIVIAGFLLSDIMNWSPAIIALVGGIIALAFGGCEPFSLLQKVSIRDILFFSGLFVLVGAAEASGALGYMSGAIVSLSFGNTLILCLLLMWVGAFVTCFLNAGPTTALFLPIVLSFKSAAPHSLYWWSLSLGVCAGSSGTLVGATAGSVTATMIDKFIKKQDDSTDASNEVVGTNSSNSTDEDGYCLTKLTFKEYASLGLPIMVIFLLISSTYITMIYRW
ncbi:MAG: SLC13 family permease [Planctomycetota bacterium]|jgi:Na+/H+ antiporter NhaD/arsenite permease-like protein/S1-C subfamily serine protease